MSIFTFLFTCAVFAEPGITTFPHPSGPNVPIGPDSHTGIDDHTPPGSGSVPDINKSNEPAENPNTQKIKTPGPKIILPRPGTPTSSGDSTSQGVSPGASNSPTETTPTEVVR